MAIDSFAYAVGTVGTTSGTSIDSFLNPSWASARMEWSAAT